jgi:hypothetical protein
MGPDVDPLLRRLERTSLVACLAMAVAAYVLGRGQWSPVAGVLGGGLLIAISYRTIGSGVGRLADLMARPRDPGGDGSEKAEGGPTLPRVGRTVLLVMGRYALLTLLAYVMIARLRLHPLGLLAGASSVVAAAVIEAGRLLSKKH